VQYGIHNSKRCGGIVRFRFEDELYHLTTPIGAGGCEKCGYFPPVNQRPEEWAEVEVIHPTTLWYRREPGQIAEVYHVWWGVGRAEFLGLVPEEEAVRRGWEFGAPPQEFFAARGRDTEGASVPAQYRDIETVLRMVLSR